MGSKEEIRVAKEVAARLQAEGDTLLKIAETLNLAYHGFYYVSDGRLYRENVPAAGHCTVIL
jgi:predicted enzyme involved in methoxymalonyl-ACP biosynthesis